MWARPPRSIILSDHLATTIPLVRISICADTCFSFYLKPLNRFQHFNLITFRTVTCQNVCWLFTLFTLLVVFLSPQLLLLFRIKHKGIKVVLTCFLKFWQEGKYEHIYRTIFFNCPWMQELWQPNHFQIRSIEFSGYTHCGKYTYTQQKMHKAIWQGCKVGQSHAYLFCCHLFTGHRLDHPSLSISDLHFDPN